MPRKLSALSPDDENYVALLDDLKARIRSAQVKAALAVNQELIVLYWNIGREILERQQEQGWGSKVVDRLSKDLKREFPDVKGFSRANLMHMRAFAQAWSYKQIVQRALDNLPWRQNLALLNKVKDPNERLWYAQQSLENGWGTTVLVAQIETNLYQREGKPVTNFERTLPPGQSELAHEALKDRYNFEFLTIAKDATAKDLKRALMAHMRDFLLELGVGFSFVRQNYHLEVDGQDYYVDMLFYHLKLRCFIVIQLEMGDFQPEHSGRMNFFLSGVDDRERGAQDQPTIGLILCQTKGQTVVEYALRHLNNPIAVAEHSSLEALPSEEQLQFELDNAIRLLEVEEILEAEIQSDETTTAVPEKLTEAALEIQKRLQLLQEMNPAASNEEAKAFVTAAIPLTLRQQAASAFQSFDKAALQGLLEADYVDTAIAVIESWRDAD